MSLRNCHCVMVPDVATEAERESLQSNGGNGIMQAEKEVADRPFANGNLKPGDRFMHAGQVVTFESWQGSAETIAGKGCRRKIDIIDYLTARYGGRAKEWKKKKRLASAVVNDEHGTVDIHWCEEPAIGKAEGKVKRDEETGIWFYPDG